MKIHLAALSLLLAFASSLASATLRENPLFDEYGNITYEAEKLRLEHFAIQIKNMVDSRGLIIVHAESSANRKGAQARARRAKWYLVKKHGVSAEKVNWRYGGACGQMLVSLYVLYPNEADPVASPNCK